MSNDRAPGRKGILSSKAASSVRRTTPVTVRCQPPSPFTRADRPPPPRATRGGRPGGAAVRLRAGAAAARPCQAPALPPPARLPRLQPRRRPPPPATVPAPRPPFPRPAPSDCAGPSSFCAASSRPARWARTRIPPPRRARCRRGRTQSRPPHRYGRSFARLRVVRRRHQRRTGRRVGREFRFHVAVGQRARSLDAQLLEQEGERLLEIRADGSAHIGRQIPEASLERTDRFLAALIDELLLGVALFPLVFCFGLHPLVHLASQILREHGMVHD